MKHGFRKAVSATLITVILTSGAFAAGGAGQQTAKNPYLPPISGMFHEQTVEGFSGAYTVYIPELFQPCSPGVMLLVPNGTTAKQFLVSAEGQKWKALADEKNIALIAVEADRGGQWNVGDSTALRDDEAFLKKVFDTIRSKNAKIKAAFDMNERAFYLVGYEKGGIAAQEFAMEWPAIICGMATVGGSAVPTDIVKSVGEAYSYPFAQIESLQGQEENKLPNNEVPVPTWIIDSATPSENSEEVVDYWVSANKATAGTANDLAQRVYENGPKRVWVTESQTSASITPDDLYDDFLSQVQRFVAGPGGRLAFTVQHTNDGKTGFFSHEENVDGFLRRWMTYVPTSYKGGKTPLVVTMHGYTSANTAFTGDTRWHDVAEKNGVIVIFPQAYPSEYKKTGNISAPVWRNYAFALEDDTPDDVSFIRSIIAKTQKQYAIDDTRIYATGHSNGSSMSWTLALDCQDLFAACAPIGLQHGAVSEQAPDPYTVMPIFTGMGEFDMFEAAVITDDNRNGVSINGWVKRNQTQATPTQSKQGNEEYPYETLTYSNKDGVPLYSFSNFKNKPHTYTPDQADWVWSHFLSNYTKQADGSRYYKNQKIANPHAAFADTAKHWAKAEIETAVSTGLVSGVSANTFAPESAVSYDMLAAIAGETPAYVGTKTLTREQAMVMAANHARTKGIAASSDTAVLNAFTDAAQISSNAKADIAFLYNAGIVKGSKQALSPKDNITRAEISCILARIQTK